MLTMSLMLPVADTGRMPTSTSDRKRTSNHSIKRC